MPTFTLTQRHPVVKVLIDIQILFIFSTPVLIRPLWPLTTVVFLHWCLMPVVPNIHRHVRKINLLMVSTACLVCLISTVNGHSKKKEKKAKNVVLVAGT